MASKLSSGLLALALLWAGSASATRIAFDDLTNIPYANPNSNGEVDGTEWIPKGLLLSSPTLALNVGCGTPVSCLGADRVSISDFNGRIDGSFVIPGSVLPAPVFSLGIDFCCEEFDRPAGLDDQTITSIFGTTGTLLARIFDTDFFFRSAVPIGSFSVDFAADAMLGLRFNEVPEPASFGLLLMSVLCTLVLGRPRGLALAERLRLPGRADRGTRATTS
jgi:hypothetical protein